MVYLLYLSVLTLFLLIYFRLALKFNIIDKPNHRSSHTGVTIRGGGIIFPISLLISFIFNGLDYPFFTSGLVLISLVSLYDDVRPLSNTLRLLTHLLAVSLLFVQAGLMNQPVWIIIIVYIFVIGAINAYNFMDGINGMTGSYSIITMISLYIINEKNTFILSDWLIMILIALIVFNFFNFRRKAKCFAGDVGSISIAFIILFFLILLILSSRELKYIGLLLLYGLDAVTTILFRLIRRENIFEAHRSHFYQYLVNVKGWEHLAVSTLFMLLQLMINILLISCNFNGLEFLFFVIVSGFVFVGVRFTVEGQNNLMTIKR